MVKVDIIQQAIKRLDGGEYQLLLNDYLHKKYKFKNFTCLGSHVGTSKTTKGTPDTYIECEDGKYILIMYGNVGGNDSFNKIKDDVKDAYTYDKTQIEEEKIKKVICCHTSNNINIGQREELKKLFENKEIEIIGIDDLSYDIAHNFQGIAKTHLNIQVDTGQISTIEEFIERHDKNSVNAPLDLNFIDRNEKNEILDIIEQENVLILMGKPGVGKTKLSIEICREYINRNSDVKCLCIRNNGIDIYEDLKDYIENDQEYLIFVDDINEMKMLKTFMDFIKMKKGETNIKVIATVRDYALENVLYKIKEYDNPKLYIINSMDDDKIKNIIEESFNIKNSRYQEQILKIANGNPRLAILAAKGIKEGKLNDLRSVIDIFQSYYVPIIEKNELNAEDVKVLFIISMLGPIKIFDEDSREFLDKFELGEKKFIEILYKLQKMELIDFFDNKAVKISDQNFGNYIEYKFLIEDKTIKISTLIDMLYPKCILKILNIINMIIEIFFKEKDLEYITSEIKELWNKEPYNNDSKFLSYFYNVDRVKAISIIKKEIDEESNVYNNLLEFDFEKKKNNQGIKNKKIDILSDFKYGELNEEAIELLLKYFIKRPDLIMEFYYAFTSEMGIDEYSYDNKYEYEINIIDKFTNEIKKDEKNKINLSVLLIKIIAKFLEQEHHITRQSHKRLTINFMRIKLIGDEITFEFRNKMFEILIELYQEECFKELIEDVFINYHVYPSDDNEIAIFKNDIEYLNTNLFIEWKNPTFIQAEILKSFEMQCNKGKIEIPDSLGYYKNNKKFEIFHNLELEKDFGTDWKKAQEERQQRVINMIQNYDIKDFSNLFDICLLVEKYNERINCYNVNTSLLDIFNYLIENKKDIFLEVFDAYIKCNTPFIIYPDILISKLLGIFDKKTILSILKKHSGDKKYCYLIAYYKNINNIDVEDINECFMLLNEQISKESVYIIDIITLLKYEAIQKGTIETFSEELLKKYENKTNVITSFFDSIFNIEKEQAKLIISSFENIETLENLYILGSYGFMDYKGKFAIELIERDENFILKIVNHIKDFQRRSSELDNIFIEIWKHENYKKYIDMAYFEMCKKFRYYEIEKIFTVEHNENKEIINRKCKWIFEYINKYYNDIDKIEQIFYVINESFIEKRKEYILQFLKLNSNCEDFKKIPLFSPHDSWSGSEIPLIDRKIEFLKELKNSISGIEYIEHKAYINLEIEWYKRYREDRRLREYLEDYLC